MDTVKRFNFTAQTFGTIGDGVTDCTFALQHAGRYVAESDYDAALAREAALREELNGYEPASPGTASKRARWLINIQDACKYGLPKHLVNRLNNTAKEIQNSIKFGGTKRLRDESESLQQRLTVAEQREGELLIMLRMAWGADHVSAEDCRRIDAELKPAAEGEGS